MILRTRSISLTSSPWASGADGVAAVIGMEGAVGGATVIVGVLVAVCCMEETGACFGFGISVPLFL